MDKERVIEYGKRMGTAGPDYVDYSHRPSLRISNTIFLHLMAAMEHRAILLLLWFFSSFTQTLFVLWVQVKG